MFNDAMVTCKVKYALINNPQTKARRIDVDTFEGTVTLTGLVESMEEARKVTGVADNVDGVKSVSNNL